MKGDAAILNAEVHAVVTRPDGQRVRLRLLDNGLGGTKNLCALPSNYLHCRMGDETCQLPRTQDDPVSLH